MDLELKQFPDGFPEKTTMIVKGAYHAGRTTFATYVSGVAMRNGLSVAYIDTYHTIKGGLYTPSITQMLQTDGECKLICLRDLLPHELAGFDPIFRNIACWADLIVIDSIDSQPFNTQIPLQQQIDGWLQKINKRAVLTYTEILPPPNPNEKLLTAGINLELHDPIPDAFNPIFPVPVLKNDKKRTITVELRTF